MLDQEQVGPRNCYVVEAIPKREDKYLFSGKIWIDEREFAIVKIAGHPARKLSFWINRADFARQYQKVGEFWLPEEDETLVDVRAYGKKMLTIEHHVVMVKGVKREALGGAYPTTAEVSQKSRTE